MTGKEFKGFRKGAREFFESLEKHLNRGLRDHRGVREHLAEVVRRAKVSADKREKRNAFPEGAFLNEFILQPVHEFVASWPGMSTKTARRALLSESWKHNPDTVSGSPGRSERHPFTKVLGATPSNITGRWSKGSLVAGSYPDMALREPFPFRTVFECKYFRHGGLQAGKTELVEGVYQAFFYLGLARLPETAKRAAWDYDFACLLALDASETAGLKKAWDQVSPSVESGIWDGANIYVMILRGSS